MSANPHGCVEHVCAKTCPGWHRAWMSKDGTVAIGLHPDGTIDEVLLATAIDAPNALLHIEQIDDDCYWMRVGGIHMHFRREKKAVTLETSWSDS